MLPFFSRSERKVWKYVSSVEVEVVEVEGRDAPAARGGGLMVAVGGCSLAMNVVLVDLFWSVRARGKGCEQKHKKHA